MRTLEERLEEFAKAWRPETGDKLIGVVVELDERQSDFDESPYPIVTVQTTEGEELAFHAYHTVAKRELAKQRPRIGERIGIAYYGKHEKGYEQYRIVVERDPTAPDWDQMQKAAELELSGSDADPGKASGDADDIPY